jgi:chemotaxis signal transduction protein
VSAGGSRGASPARRTVLKVLEPGMELLLFRLGDRGYASPRERVREVVDIGAGQPAVPGLSASSLGKLGGGQRPVALVSLRVALGLPDRGPEGRILVVATRTGPVGFLVDEVVRVLRYDIRLLPARVHPPQRVRDGQLPDPRRQLAADRLGRHPPPGRDHRAR